MNYSERQLDILARLENQLKLTEKLLATHPLVNEKLMILQNAIHFLAMQTQWSSAGSVAKLLISFQTALKGMETEESASGFAGPTWQKMHQAAYGLIVGSLSLTERKQAPLLNTLTEVMSIGAVYVATQVLGNWKRIFYQGDPATAKKGGLLLRELGLNFLVHTQVIESAFKYVAEGLEIGERSQKLVMEIGLFFILVVIMLVDKEDNPNNEDIIEAFSPLLKQSIGSVEQALQKMQEKGLIGAEKGAVAESQLQVVKQTLESTNPGALKELIEDIFLAHEIPYGAVKKDLGRVIDFCSQVNESMNNVFFQKALTETSMIQSA